MTSQIEVGSIVMIRKNGTHFDDIGKCMSVIKVVKKGEPFKVKHKNIESREVVAPMDAVVCVSYSAWDSFKSHNIFDGKIEMSSVGIWTVDRLIVLSGYVE